MVKYIPDRSGRFKTRPYYSASELDRECELIITQLLNDRCKEIRFPVSTDDLQVLIEREAEELDIYADLSAEGPNVEGVTYFRRGQKPLVKISQELSTARNRENRFRTTLAHEFGHVRFHDPLFQFADFSEDLYSGIKAVDRALCHRDRLPDPPQTDWMEWQASYVSSSLLMPVTPLRRTVGSFLEQHRLFGALQASSAHGRALCSTVAATFQVSEEAARVRLSNLQLISAAPTQPGLFG